MSDLPDFDPLWNYDDPAATEQKFRQLLPQASGHPAYHAQLLTQIARTEGLQRRFESAHRTLDEAYQLIQPGDTLSRIRYALERGRVYNSSRHPEQARGFFVEAYELASAAGEDSCAVDAAHMIAIIESMDQQLHWNLKAVALAENSAQPRAREWLGSLYNNIGWTYHDLKQYEQALAIFQKALQFRQQQNQPKPIHIARWCVARVLRSLNRIDEALAIQRDLLKEEATSGESDGYVYEEIGECLLAKSDPEDSSYFARAYQLLSQDAWLVENEAARLERLKDLGESTA